MAGSISFYQLNCKVPEWKLGPGSVDFQVTQGGRPLDVSSDASLSGEENGESLNFEYYTTTSGVLAFTKSSFLAYDRIGGNSGGSSGGNSHLIGLTVTRTISHSGSASVRWGTDYGDQGDLHFKSGESKQVFTVDARHHEESKKASKQASKPRRGGNGFVEPGSIIMVTLNNPSAGAELGALSVTQVRTHSRYTNCVSWCMNEPNRMYVGPCMWTAV